MKFPFKVSIPDTPRNRKATRLVCVENIKSFLYPHIVLIVENENEEEYLAETCTGSWKVLKSWIDKYNKPKTLNDLVIHGNS